MESKKVVVVGAGAAGLMAASAAAMYGRKRNINRKKQAVSAEKL